MADSPVISYLSQDFESIYEDIVQFAIKTFPAELWTDFNASQVGMYLLRVKAYIGDILAYQLNASVMETLLTKVVRERNMRLLARGVGYVMKSATPASTRLRVYDLPTPPNVAYPFTISLHHQFTLNGVTYQPTADKVVTDVSVLNNVDDGYYTDIDVTEGVEVFEEAVGTSNGTPAQTYALQQGPLLDGTLTVSVNADGGYTQVSTFSESITTSRHFRLYTDEDGIATMEFGNGINGKIPSLGQAIVATYRIGGGIEGNAQTELLTWAATGSTSPGSPLPSVLQAASIRNITAATGGGAKESIEAARRNIPGFLRSNDRAVTAQDYADLARLVSGVLHAKSLVGKPALGSRPIYLFLVPAGGGTPSPTLISNVAAYLSPRKEVGRVVRIGSARYVNVKIGIDAYLEPAARKAIAQNYLERATAFAFDIEGIDYSEEFPLQAMYDYIDPVNIPGLKRAYIRTFAIEDGWDVYISRTPVGNGLVTYIETNNQLAVTREWNVRFVNPTPPLTCPQYEVYERVNGVATAVYGNSVTDNGNYFPASQFVSWSLVPKPEDGNTGLFTVVANTDRTLQVNAGNLNSYLQVGDAFAVELLAPNRGKVIKNTITANSAGSFLTVASTVNWEVNDEILVTDGVGNQQRAKVTAILGPTQLGTDQAVISVLIGDTVEFVWKDAAGRVEFSIDEGTIAWNIGDELYVDTYSEVGDLILRNSDFPILDPSDVSISLIGGVE